MAKYETSEYKKGYSRALFSIENDNGEIKITTYHESEVAKEEVPFSDKAELQELEERVTRIEKLLQKQLERGFF